MEAASRAAAKEGDAEQPLHRPRWALMKGQGLLAEQAAGVWVLGAAQI